MDREASQWKRSAAAGLAVLALSLGGQAALSAGSEDAEACERPGLVEKAFDRLVPQLGAPVLAQRMARAVLSVVVHACS